MYKFSDILKDLIEEEGKSLREIARLSGVSATQYGKYLKGANPTINVAEKIVKYFDCSFDYLFGLSEEKSNKTFHKVNMEGFVDKYLHLLKQNQTTNWKFSKQFNLSESNLRHWEYGNLPKIETLVVIARELNSSIDYLVGRDNNF